MKTKKKYPVNHHLAYFVLNIIQHMNPYPGNGLRGFLFHPPKMMIMVDCILAKRLKSSLKNMYLNASNSCNFVLKIVKHNLKVIEY